MIHTALENIEIVFFLFYLWTKKLKFQIVEIQYSSHVNFQLKLLYHVNTRRLHFPKIKHIRNKNTLLHERM